MQSKNAIQCMASRPTNKKKHKYETVAPTQSLLLGNQHDEDIAKRHRPVKLSTSTQPQSRPYVKPGMDVEATDGDDTSRVTVLQLFP